jgi:hypothetical protein
MNYQDRSGSRIIIGEREREEGIYKSSISKREVRLWGVGEDFNASRTVENLKEMRSVTWCVPTRFHLPRCCCRLTESQALLLGRDEIIYNCLNYPNYRKFG